MTLTPPQTFDPANRPVRTRIAPSPTGFFHVGGGRTALYNLFFARQHAGKFILRIEDTDENRHQEDAVTGIQNALTWLGVDWDEGPFRQSTRFESYREAAEKLYASGNAYWCDLTPEQIAERAKANGKPGYDGYSRDRGLGPGEGHVLRFRVPEGKTTVPDIIRDNPVFDNDNIEDFVLLRSSGVATWLMAVTADDIDMQISHVIRGDEHLPNTPKQMMIWEALGGGPVPVFAHLPVLVNDKRQKLSKRRDKVAMEDYQADGILPEAMRNYLTLLGWAPGEDRELLTMEESIELFRLEDVKSAPAFFDVVKLTNTNGQYIRAMEKTDFTKRSEQFLGEGHSWSEIEPLVSLVQERVSTLAEVANMVDFFFVADDAVAYDETGWAKVSAAPTTKVMLEEVLGEFRNFAELGTWDHDVLHDAVLRVGEANGLKLGKAQAPIRFAVTGRTVGPPLFESCAVLGASKSIKRLEVALAKLV